MMSIKARQEYAREISLRYERASRADKGRILDEFCQTSGYHRKYAICVLRSPPSARTTPVRRPRAKRYGPDVQRALSQLWEASDYLCAKRLVPFLRELMAALERHGELCLPTHIQGKLLAISLSTADRLLAAARRSHPLRGLATTKPGTLLRDQIRVRTSFGWDELKPGYFEVDLVAHCAESAAGEFLHTLTLTDIATGWTECQGLPNRSQTSVTEAIERCRKLLPFPILGIDSDNGTEFINHNLKRYCDEHKIEFTRCRPYKKNDQCHVEQKNWTVVRRHIGYARYTGAAECKALQSAYRWLRCHVNYFQPSLKLIGKERHEAKVRKRYDQAQTPYQRLLASGLLDAQTKADQQEYYLALNPADILRELRLAILRLQKCAADRIATAVAPEHEKPHTGAVGPDSTPDDPNGNRNA